MFQILIHQVSESFAKEKIFRKRGGNLMKVKLALSFSYPNVFLHLDDQDQNAAVKVACEQALQW